MRISAIIVSYQVRDLLRRCLISLTDQQAVDLDLWVVDNASLDGSAEMVAAEFPSVHLIRNTENVGFARANNQALRQTAGDILALINPDTEWPPHGLRVAADVFCRHPLAGAVGLALVGPDGSPQPSCHAFPGLLNVTAEAIGIHRLALRFGYGTPTSAPVPPGGEGKVDWVSGACFLIRRKAYTVTGGLNEACFMYGEEADWSWRARSRGFSTVFCNRARVIHHGGASGVGQRGELFVMNIEARLEFLRRHRGRWRAALAREVMALGSLGRLAYWKWRAFRERGEPGTQTRDQLERFRSVVAWRWGRGV